MKELFLKKYNTALNKLLDILHNIIPIELSIKEIVDGNDINYFYNENKNIALELSEKNTIIFSKEFNLINKVDFNKIWNSTTDEIIKENIWKQLHYMYLYADQYCRDVNLNKIMKLYKQASNSDHLKVDLETQILFGIIGNVCQKHSEKPTNNIKNTDEKPSDNSKDNVNPLDLSKLLNGQIGKLATDIAEDLDTSKLDLENPINLLNGLLNGDSSQNSPIFNLVGEISNKIQNKITDGDINELELLDEAKSALGLLGGNSQENPMNMLQNLLKQMNNTDIGQTVSNNPLDNRKEILRKKLKNKKDKINMKYKKIS